MSREIIKYPNPILRKKCDEVKEVTLGIKELALDMAETMIQGQGIGLAAPQVGELKRIIAVQAGKEPKIFINPKIIKKSKEIIIDEEGCLSFPNLFLKIKRAKEVEIEALNISGEKIRITAVGLTAWVFQHEIDHLDGILFIDKIDFWQRFKLKNKLKKQKIK